MAGIFIVQKRPANGVSNGYYYRIVDACTGKAVNQNFLNALHAEAHCQNLNDEAFRRAMLITAGIIGTPNTDRAPEGPNPALGFSEQ